MLLCGAALVCGLMWGGSHDGVGSGRGHALQAPCCFSLSTVSFLFEVYDKREENKKKEWETEEEKDELAVREGKGEEEKE